MKGITAFSRPSSPTLSHSTISPSSETIMEENIEFAEEMIKKWDIEGSPNRKISSLFADDRNEAKKFLDAVQGLQKVIQYYINLSSSSHTLIQAQNLMQTAMKRLEKEFYTILSSNRNVLDAESVSTRDSTWSSIPDYCEDGVSEDGYSLSSLSISSESEKALDIAVADLKSIADCMIGSGYGKECVKIYDMVRKSMIDETLYCLGFEASSPSEIQKMEWDVLESKIRSWLHAVKISVKTLFNGERMLCDSVFTSEKSRESCFVAISKDAATNLFQFPENFAKCKKILSPEKIFRALDMYEAISDTSSEIESIFSYDSLSAVRSLAMASLEKLGEAIRVMLSQFESAIQKDASKCPPGGGIHPLSRYVMNYMVFLGDYSGALADIVVGSSETVQSPLLPESFFSSPIHGSTATGDSTITVRFAWLILVLLCKLDGKAKLYDDVALSYLFLANNLNYVVLKVRNSNLGILIGSEWICNHESKVKQYVANFERIGWTDVITSLPENPMAMVSHQEAVECLGNFNSSFQETYKKQKSWVISDSKLRDRVKISLSQKIVSGYRVFYDKHKKFSEELGSELIFKYVPEDLDNYLSDLFFKS